MQVHAKLSLGKKSWEYGQPIAPQPSVFDTHFHSPHSLFPATGLDPFAPRNDLFPPSLCSASSHGFGHDFFDMPGAPPEMQAMVHAQREQLQASPLGPHMRGMGILPPLYADSSSSAMPHSAPRTHPLDAAVEDTVQETRRESLEGCEASSERPGDADDQHATKAKKTPITSPSEVSLANTLKANSAPPPPSYTPQLNSVPVPTTVIHESRTRKVKKKTKTVFRRVIGLNLPFLFVGYKHKVTVTHY